MDKIHKPVSNLSGREGWRGVVLSCFLHICVLVLLFGVEWRFVKNNLSSPSAQIEMILQDTPSVGDGASQLGSQHGLSSSDFNLPPSSNNLNLSTPTSGSPFAKALISIDSVAHVDDPDNLSILGQKRVADLGSLASTSNFIDEFANREKKLNLKPTAVEATPFLSETAKSEPVPLSDKISRTNLAAGTGQVTGSAVLAAIDKRYANQPPLYPYEALERGSEGRVVLDVLINKNGKPMEARIIQQSGDSLLDSTAQKAVMSWWFHPATLDGVAQDSHLNVSIEFSLENQSANFEFNNIESPDLQDMIQGPRDSGPINLH